MAAPQLQKPIPTPVRREFGGADVCALVSDIFRTGVHVDSWRDLLLSVANAFQGPVSITTWLDPASPGGEPRAWTDLPVGGAPGQLRRLGRFLSKTELPRGRIIDLADLFIDIDYDEAPQHREWLRSAGLAPMWPLVFLSEAGPGRPTGGVILHRRRPSQPFSESEVALAGFLGPHLTRGLAIREGQREARRSRLALAELVDRLLPGVVFFDRTGRIVSRNRSSSAVLSGDFGLRLESDRLRASRPAEDSHLCGLIRSVTGPRPTSSLHEHDHRAVMTVSYSDTQPPLSISLMRFLDGANAVHDATPVACALIGNPSVGTSSGFIGSLKQLFGLSQAEAELARLLVEGRSLQEAAEIRQTSFNTVRTQIAKIFRKTGTARQSDLVRLVLTTVPTVAAA